MPTRPVEKLGQELAADEGYFAIEEVAQLHECGVRTAISDPHAERRRPEQASPEHQVALRKARRTLASASGKALLRRRGEHLERSFCHVLDHGGLRRATLRGTEKLSKRHLLAAATYNLSLLLRKLYGVGTPKQALAGLSASLSPSFRLHHALWALSAPPMLFFHAQSKTRALTNLFFHWRPRLASRAENRGISTGC